MQGLVERGLAPRADAEVAERSVLMSSMQTYATADAIARLEIERSRVVSEIDRQPSEAAQAILIELEEKLIDADIAVAQLKSIDESLALLGGPSSAPEAMDFEYILHRGSGDAAVAESVDQDQTLLPGDVLEVVSTALESSP